MWKDEFMHLCFNSSVPDDISVSYEIKNSHIPSKLYRFRPFTAYTIDEIQYQYVRLVSPRTFNDLLDTRAKIDFSDKFYGNNSSLKETYRQQMQKHFSVEELDRILEKGNWFDEMLKEVSIKEALKNKVSAEKIAQSLKHAIDTEIIDLNDVAGSMGQFVIRCCCFTETKSNLAMWNHYAGYYSGICIEYDMSKFRKLDLQRRFMYPVIYTSELPNIYNQITNFEPKYVNLFTWVALHKKLEWQYENEWRLIFSGIYQEDTNCSFPVISAIYLGNKIEKENREELIKLARKMNIDIYNMVLKNNAISFIKE